MSNDALNNGEDFEELEPEWDDDEYLEDYDDSDWWEEIDLDEQDGPTDDQDGTDISDWDDWEV